MLIIAKNEEELQALLDACTKWAEGNCLVWKPQKYSIVTNRVEEGANKQFMLVEQSIPINGEARYLGIIITPTGFNKTADI